MNIIGKTVGWVSRRFGYQMVRCQGNGCPLDFDQETSDTVLYARPYTKTTPARIHSLVSAVRHVVEHDVPGAIVECGVWRGGSMMAVARTLLRLGVNDRDLYLFDTFEGMSAPSEHDVARNGVTAESKFLRRATGTDSSTWCLASLEDVQANMRSTGYPQQRIHFIKGKVEETLPGAAPEQIALLRLDTDWYESTRHELEQLYPRLVAGGCLIIDDYGDWLGARKAMDEYIAQQQLELYLHRVDDSARLAVKPSARRAA